MGRRTGQPRISVAERPGSTAPPPDKEGAEGAAEPEGALRERSEGGAAGRGGPAYRNNSGGGTGNQSVGGQGSGYQSGGYNNKRR